MLSQNITRNTYIAAIFIPYIYHFTPFIFHLPKVYKASISVKRRHCLGYEDSGMKK